MERPAPHSTTAGFSVIKSAETGMEDNSSVYVGERVTYTIVLDNQSTDELTDVLIADVLPKDTLEGESITCDPACELVDEEQEIPEPSGGFIVVTATRQVSWTLPTSLAVGEWVTLTLSGKVIGQPEGAVFTNRAFVSYVADGGQKAASSNELDLVAHIPIPEGGGGGISSVPTWFSDDMGGTISQDWGDFDRDGYLDLALGSSLGATVYENDDGRLVSFWSSPRDDPERCPGDGECYRLSYGVRWADVDESNDSLELVVVGNSEDHSATAPGLNYIYTYSQTEQTFFETSFFSTPHQLVRLEPGDFDGDGDIDLVGSTNAINAPYPVDLYRNDGSGHFTGTVASGAQSEEGGSVTETVDAAQHYVEHLAQNATAVIRSADYDNDGDLDLALGAFPGTLRLLENVRNGGVITDANPFDVDNPIDVETSLEYLPYDLAWGDYDGDGYLDLAAGYPLQREVRIYHNDAGAELTPITQTLRTVPFMTPLTLDWGDFNGDGRLDLGVADSPAVIYEYDEASDTFSPAAISDNLPPNRGQVWSTRGIDLDNRGNLELVMTNRDGPTHRFTTFAPKLERSVTPVGSKRAGSAAWGDADHDGDLDLIFGASSGQPPSLLSALYVNDGGQFSARKEFQPSGFGPHAVAFGEVNGNGRLDVVVGTPAALQVYLDGETDSAAWSVTTEQPFHSVAWGDADDDGALDLLAGKEDGTVELYLNQGGQLASTPAFSLSVGGDVRSLAWADFDDDHYLDFAVGIDGARAQVYRNRGDVSFEAAWRSPSSQPVRALAWADYDADGDPDLTVGNYGADDLIWENLGGVFTDTCVWSSSTSFSKTTSLAWGDWDHDGYLELAVGKDGEPDVVYANQGSEPGTPRLIEMWRPDESDAQTAGLAWGDFDGDGDLDLAAARRGGEERSGFYENTMMAPAHLSHAADRSTPLPNNPPHLYLERPGDSDDGYFFSAPEVLAGPNHPTVTVRYELYDPEADQAAATFFEYSLDGGSGWHEATPAEGVEPITRTSATGRRGTFVWDAAADDAVSDNARFRVRVVPRDRVGPVQRASSSAVSPPFRVRAVDCFWPAGVSMEITPTHPLPGEEVEFSTHVDTGSGRLTAHWDFGDGSPEETGWSGVRHTFESDGVFTVTLRVEGPACPIARPGYARQALVVGRGDLQRVYLPIVMRSAEGAAGKLGDWETGRLVDQEIGRLGRNSSTNLPIYPPEGRTNPPARRAYQSTDTTDATTYVTNFSQGVSSQPAANADGSRIAFWSTWTGPGDQNNDGNIEIFLAELLGGGSVAYTQITSSTGSILGGFNLAPSISDAGDRIAFFSDRDLNDQNPDRNFEVFLADLSGGTTTLAQVTDTSRGVNILPDLSGDGGCVAFVSDQNLTGGNADGNMEIFRAEIGPSGGVTLTQVTISTDVINDQPAVDYDGNRIAFVSDRDGNREVYLAEIDSSGGVEIYQVTSSDDGVNDQPDINATGDRLAFISDQSADGSRQVFTADLVAGTHTFDIAQVSSGGGEKDQPSISADGVRIAYISIEGANDRRLRVYDVIDEDEITTGTGGDNAHPALGADGLDVAFVSNWNVVKRNYPLAELSIGKSDDPDEATVGETLTYTLVVNNTGPSESTGVVVTDTLHPGLVAQLPDAPSDYVDDDNDLDGFLGGTYTGTTWNTGDQWLELSGITNIFEMPDDGGDDDAWMDMSGNTLLLHLNESSGNTFADSSGNNHDGACASCPDVGEAGKLGQALLFDGQNDRVSLASASDLHLNNSDFTVAAWIKITEYAGNRDEAVMGTESTAPNHGLHLVVRDGKPYMGFYANDTEGSTTLSPGVWYHVVWRYRTSDLQQAIFVDGQRDVAEVGHAPFQGTGTVYLGYWRGSDPSYFDGYIDEVAVFDRALTNQEIRNLYRRQAPAYAGRFESRVMTSTTDVGSWRVLQWLPDRPVGQELPDYAQVESGYPTGNVDMFGNVLMMHLNDPQGSTDFEDTSGKENHGYCSTGTEQPQAGVGGRLKRGLLFDGDDDFVRFNYFNEFPATALTLEFWMRSMTDKSYIAPLSYATFWRDNEVTLFFHTSDSALEVWIGDRYAFVNDVAVVDGAWHHVAMTWRSSDGQLSVYRDGTLVDSQTLRAGYTLFHGGQLVLGQDQDCWGGCFDAYQAFEGTLDEFAIFNRALSAEEVEDHYLRGALRMVFQARSCDSVDCSNEPFVGPDGTRADTYSPLTDPALSLPAFTLSGIDQSKRYIQYRACLSSSDAAHTPALRRAEILPEVQCSGQYTVTCRLISIPAGGPPIDFNLPVTVTTEVYTTSAVVGGELGVTNTATVESDQSDHTPWDSRVSIQTPLKPIPLTGVTISAPSEGSIDEPYTFRAEIQPDNATPPVTYTWQATGQSEVVHTGWRTDEVTFTWSATGPQTVTVFAADSFGTIVSDTHVINVKCYALSGVVIAGPTTGTINRSYTFTSTASPPGAMLPITYTWVASRKSPITHIGGGITDTVQFTWGVTGTQSITVTAVNPCGTVVEDAHSVAISSP